MSRPESGVMWIVGVSKRESMCTAEGEGAGVLLMLSGA